MYMYPGHSSAVVIFSGLPPLAPGQVYQFWFADETGQVAGTTFVADPTGIGYIVVEAPREVNAFREVMITVEPSGGSATPSQNVILEGAL
jgi:anti-sigma-K factor RskA